jgi:hypothetical protein
MQPLPIYDRHDQRRPKLRHTGRKGLELLYDKTVRGQLDDENFRRTWACSPISDNCNCASNGHGINLGFGKPNSLRAGESKGCSFKGAAAATYFSRLGRVLCSFESP